MFENLILEYDNAKILYEEIKECSDLKGSTAEVGVYEGFTSKMIIEICNKNHYCYDTFEGIVDSFTKYGDVHVNGEFVCQLDKVKSNINGVNCINGVNGKNFNKEVFYKKGIFPDTFEEHSLLFSFVYSDTATYLGTKNTFEYFKKIIVPNGKIIFYIDDNCLGVKNAIEKINDNTFNIKYKSCFVIFTKI